MRLVRQADLVQDIGRAAEAADKAVSALPGFGRSHQHVVERAVLVEQIHHLERARDAEASDRPGRQAGDVAAFEAHAPAVGRVAAGEEVEAGGLAGAVRAHDAREPALREAHAHVLEHDVVPESFMQVFCLKH
jgi:hypothetical protein